MSTDDVTALIEAPRSYRRLVGRVRGRQAGPTLIVTAGIHGNEGGGVEAAERVLSRLDSESIEPIGEFVVLAGNLRALEDKTRFLEDDLNRIWTPARVRALRDSHRGSVEQREQWQLLGQLREIVDRARERIHFMDLHTSSAEGPPFLTVGDTLRNRRFASKLPLPLILGLEEQVDGSLLEFLNNFGFVTLGMEGGQHDSRAAVDCFEAMLWLALVAAGLLPAGRVPGFEEHERLLREASRGIPRVVEVRSRHAITPQDDFRMQPGFSNFQAIRRGQLMAHDRRGEIHAAEEGLVLLPLYQGKGDDGFFSSREVRMFWLRVSGVVRRLRLNRLMSLLPGVRRHPERPEVLTVDTRIARWYPLEIFHLFGFRKLRRAGDELTVSRRRYDLTPPQQIRLS